MSGSLCLTSLEASAGAVAGDFQEGEREREAERKERERKQREKKERLMAVEFIFRSVFQNALFFPIQ